MLKRAANFRWMNLLHEALGSRWGVTSSAQFIFLCCHQTWIPATPILCNQSTTECSKKIVDLCASGHIPEAWRKWSLWLPRPNLLREFHHLCHLWNFSQHMVEISSKHTGCSFKCKLVLIPTNNFLWDSLTLHITNSPPAFLQPSGKSPQRKRGKQIAHLSWLHYRQLLCTPCSLRQAQLQNLPNWLVGPHQLEHKCWLLICSQLAALVAPHTLSPSIRSPPQKISPPKVELLTVKLTQTDFLFIQDRVDQSINLWWKPLKICRVQNLHSKIEDYN